MNDLTLIQAVNRQSWPLCRRYLVGFLERVCLRLRENGVVRDQWVRWGLGVLADGEYEVLGVWVERGAGVNAWHEAFEDLQVRGVETVRFIVSSERAAMRAGGSTAYWGATGLPSTGQLLRQSMAEAAPLHRSLGSNALGAIRQAGTAQAAWLAVSELEAGPWAATYPADVIRWRDAVERLEPLYALNSRLQHLVRCSDETAERLAETLQRSVSCRGCFSSEKAAGTFVSEVLDRAGRRVGIGNPYARRDIRSFGVWRKAPRLRRNAEAFPPRVQA